MPKFVIQQTIACWVDFTHTVDAETKEEALLLFNEGMSELVSSDVGPNVDWVEEDAPIIIGEEN